MNTIALITTLAAFTACASAQVHEYTVDPAQSTMELEIQIRIDALGNTSSDSDSSSISGTINAELDSDQSPTEISLHDYQLMLDNDLEFDWNLGFLSNASADLQGALVQYANQGTIVGPNQISQANEFAFNNVPTEIIGDVNISYNIFLVGQGSQSIDLSTLEPASTSITGTIENIDGQLIMSFEVDYQGAQPLELEGTVVGEVLFSGTATVIATADASPPCAPDLNNDGTLNFFDVSLFLNLFGQQDPAADINNDGSHNFFDVSEFLNLYGQGCP